MDQNLDLIGREMHALASRLFPICRSLTGEGVRETLRILRQHIPLTMHEVPSGTQAFDWTVPKEWNIRDAYILDEAGKKIVDFKKNNLHVVGYSTPIDAEVSLEELKTHLHTLEAQPDAIPYVTSYYREQWGFCMTENQRRTLTSGRYRVRIDSDLEDGSLTYGECRIPGASSKEIFLSTYVCHPSMANNELSGPCVTTFLAKWIASEPRRYSYRIVFIPETIGSIVYLSRNVREMKKKIIAGFNVSCVGDDRAYSYLPSRGGYSLADRAAISVLENTHPEYVRYSFLDRGSDERQYCAPNIDLPIASIMRTKYVMYPEYHTSLDDLSLVTPSGLAGAYDALSRAIELIERNETYAVTTLGEPQLGKRGLYPTTSSKGSSASVRTMMNVLAYADGTRDLIELARTIRRAPWELYPIIEKLEAAGLLRKKRPGIFGLSS